jgi:hypothetical protein
VAFYTAFPLFLRIDITRNIYADIGYRFQSVGDWGKFSGPLLRAGMRFGKVPSKKQAGF